MKRFILLFSLLFSTFFLYSQNCYWVFFTDKNGTEFNPYNYFDEKAIARRVANNLSLYDPTDFPLNPQYVETVADIADELVGETRWFNAVGIAATEAQIDIIAKLPFVKSIELIDSDLQLAAAKKEGHDLAIDDAIMTLHKQLQRMGGDAFLAKGIDGKGKRIAVFDGGFPNVDKHDAFEHLRSNNQILKTWNFPKKIENVYGWDTHGTMVLSCIAGIVKNRNEKIGLATGAEFLLARTEVDLEPKKEEIWWLAAVEWADKNGADIINSSLGYNKPRYNPKDMDGKKSIVSRAANLAAKKGILVCNSMGNEADDPTWKVVITPADADSILSVGGIDPETDRHISFSSFGPTADGRLKPNVCAYGKAVVANPQGTMYYSEVYGTSFSSPLLAGFAACAWQTRPTLTAMELKREIEQSGELAPYYDYAYGYGIPQASYFTNGAAPETAPTCFFVKHKLCLYLCAPPIEIGDCAPFINDKLTAQMLIHIADSTGKLLEYYEVEFNPTKYFIYRFNLQDVSGGRRVAAYYNHYTTSVDVEKEEILEKDIVELAQGHAASTYRSSRRTPKHDYTSRKFGVMSKYYLHPYLSWGFAVPTTANSDYTVNYGKSQALLVGLRFKWNATSYYNLGLALEVGSNWFNVSNYESKELSFKKENLKTTQLSAEFYQRFRFIGSQIFKEGLFLDAGIYASWVFSNHHLMKSNDPENSARKITVKERHINEILPFNWGVRLRLGYDIFAVYAQYRLSDLLQKRVDLPKFEVGVQFSIPLSLN